MVTNDERTVDEEGRVTIPEELRGALGLSSGKEVTVERRGDDVVIHAANSSDRPTMSAEEFIETMEGYITEENRREDAEDIDPMDPLGLDDPLGGLRDRN
jgi:AbrB family looped-hinge helix DNA binding protein